MILRAMITSEKKSEPENLEINVLELTAVYVYTRRRQLVESSRSIHLFIITNISNNLRWYLLDDVRKLLEFVKTEFIPSNRHVVLNSPHECSKLLKPVFKYC